MTETTCDYCHRVIKDGELMIQLPLPQGSIVLCTRTKCQLNINLHEHPENRWYITRNKTGLTKEDMERSQNGYPII